jgi:hypothetical protein
VTSVTEAPTSELSGPSQGDEDELDPELLELPDPPKRERTVVIAMLLFTAVASLAMIFALRRDAAYAFVPAEPADVGDLAVAPASAFAENRFVRASGMLGAAHAIRYERPVASDSFRLMPIAGHPNIWVEVRVPAGRENVRYVPPDHFVGRLVRFEAAGPKHRGLASAVRDATGQEVTRDAWLLVEGDSPSGFRWAALLVVLFAGFAAWNVFVTAKLLRKVH